MAENDIYNNKEGWDRFVNNLEDVLEKPQEQNKCRGKRKYWCKNKANLRYFKDMIRRFEVDDTSYIRRLRLSQTLKMLSFYIDCDLKDVNGKDKDNLIVQIRKNTSPAQLKNVERDVKRVGKIIFSDKKMPKFFQELEIKTDRSRQRGRKDKLTFEQYTQLMQFFSNDPCLQFWIALTGECLVRPQEACYTKIGDVEHFNKNYAKITISEHGKEGIKKLLVLDAYPYLLKWLQVHPARQNKEAYLFLNSKKNQLTPHAINRKLKIATKTLGLPTISPYSIKRFGVTFKRLSGVSDVEIMHTAGWTSTKQLKVYDLSDQEDIFKRQLMRRGIIKDELGVSSVPQSKPCPYCNAMVGFADTICNSCHHIIDSNTIKDAITKDAKLIEFMEGLKATMEQNPQFYEAMISLGKKQKIIKEDVQLGTLSNKT